MTQFIHPSRWVVFLLQRDKNQHIAPDYVTAIKTIIAASASGIITNLYANTVPWIKLFTGGTLFLLTYITSVLLLKILKHQDLNNLENITRTLGPLSPIIKRTIKLLRPLFTS